MRNDGVGGMLTRLGISPCAGAIDYIDIKQLFAEFFNAVPDEDEWNPRYNISHARFQSFASLRRSQSANCPFSGAVRFDHG
jgi:hypothetical protein